MPLSQLRQDVVSGDWIVIAPNRRKRPDQFKSIRRQRAPQRGCPFELRTKTHREPILAYTDARGLTLQIIANKFPAFSHRDTCTHVVAQGPYAVTEGIGYHDIVITRDHHKDFPDLSRAQAEEVFAAFRERYTMLTHDRCLAYVSIFHNWGPAAGASIYHPHYQIIGIPAVPPDVQHSLDGALRYFNRHRSCVHCAIIAWERKQRARVICENEDAIVFAPFFSKNAFEFRVFPKKHNAYFEASDAASLAGVVEVLRTSLAMMKWSLRDPDSNFFVHTAPLRRNGEYKSYHWHLEVFPKITIPAGFELGTGIDINSVDPDDAARILRGKGIK